MSQPKRFELGPVENETGSFVEMHEWAAMETRALRAEHDRDSYHNQCEDLQGTIEQMKKDVETYKNSHDEQIKEMVTAGNGMQKQLSVYHHKLVVADMLIRSYIHFHGELANEDIAKAFKEMKEELPLPINEMEKTEEEIVSADDNDSQTD